MARFDLEAGDLITIAGVFREGSMDERRQYETENVQSWRVAVDGGEVLLPVLPSGETDAESYWFGRASGIKIEHGRVGVVSQPTFAGRN